MTSDPRRCHPYVLLLDSGPVLGLDPRPLAEVEAEWLAKSRRSSERDAQRIRAEVRAEIANERLLERKVEKDDPYLSPEGVGDGVGLDEVAAPPPEVIASDEVLRLSGAPGGYGSVAVLASLVLGVARAWGEHADDLRAGAREEARRARRSRGGSP